MKVFLNKKQNNKHCVDQIEKTEKCNLQVARQNKRKQGNNKDAF